MLIIAIDSRVLCRVSSQSTKYPVAHIQVVLILSHSESGHNYGALKTLGHQYHAPPLFWCQSQFTYLSIAHRLDSGNFSLEIKL